MPQMLTPKQVAARLAVSPRTVYLWIETGRLPAVRLSERVTRVSEEDLAAFESAGATGRRPVITWTSRRDMVAEPQAVYAKPTLEPISGGAGTPTERLRGLLDKHREDIFEVAKRRRAENIRVFGSVARGDAHGGSDIDLLVDLMPHASLFDLSGLKGELESLLGVEVDVVPATSVKPQIRDRVLDEATPL